MREWQTEAVVMPVERHGFRVPRMLVAAGEMRWRPGQVIIASLLGLALALSSPHDGHAEDALRIDSAILRNRVVLLDEVVMKKALYVAFSTAPGARGAKKLQVHGWLRNGDITLAEATLSMDGERAGNLAFDLPYEIPKGTYSITIEARTDEGRTTARGSRTLDRSALRSDASEQAAPALASLRELPLRSARNGDPVVTDAARARGYVLFARSPFTYVRREDIPRRHEMIQGLFARTARNATATLSFSIYAIRNIGKVRIAVSDLRSKDHALRSDRLRVACVDSIPDTTGAPQGTFRSLPAKLRPVSANASAGEDCRRYWITIRVGTDVAPGSYSGRLIVTPESAAATALPITLTVTPVVLEDIPGVDYCMLMTYEFTELTMPWSPGDQEKIRRAAARVLEDYKDHGMTTLCLHSPFVWMTTSRGEPSLDDIQVALRSARTAGFVRPIVWYMGHLIQTAKPRHPGSIRGFDEKIHLERLHGLVRTVSEFARKEGYPGVIFLPIDEPDDSYQDSSGRRLAITPALVRAIKNAGGTSMVSGERYAELGRPDYVASSRLNTAERDRAHAGGARYWVYENQVTMECTSPAFARYQYGLFTWKNRIDGMSSWTFQNTQNAAGMPGNANPPGPSGRDVYLAYPSPSGPVATIKWEAIRAGIEDHKLIYQLSKRIARMKSEGKDVGEFESFLAELRAETMEPCCDASACPADEARWFEQRRESILAMTLRAEEATR